jgi:hypothetical protein
MVSPNGSDRNTDTLPLMRTFVRRYVTIALVLAVGSGVSGCSPALSTEREAQNTLPSCDEIVPAEIMQDVLGAGGHLVQLHETEPNSVSSLVDTMVTDGVACGGATDAAFFMDGAVMIGQLAASEPRWEEIQEELAAEGLQATEDSTFAGSAYISTPGEDPATASGFVWSDGVIYYVMNPWILAFLPAFSAAFADDTAVPHQ